MVGSNNDGVWNEEGASIRITVTPPWWATTWFRGSVVVLLVGAVAGLFLWQRRSAQRRERSLGMQVDRRTKELIIAKEEAEVARSEAEAANQAKSTFLALMSHDLRTPLNGILGYAQILRRDPSTTTKQQRGLNVIEGSGKYLLTLINDVLDLARVESGVIELYQTDFHLPLLVKSVSETIRVRAEQKGLVLETQMDELPERVHGDERRLRQVLVNLIDNAVKFTEEGSVTFRVERLGSEEPIPNPQSPISNLRFTIQDTGIGIPPEKLESIFDPFEQMGDHERRVEGTGLGLAISRNLVELMGGELQVQSPPSIPPIGGEVRGGREGLKQALDWRPDAIITDLIMPEMDGFELIRQVRQSPDLSEVVLIATSASVYEKDQQRSLDAGGDIFIAKSIEADLLLEALGRILDLEWLVREPVDGLQEEPGEFALPPRDTLETLLELTEMGDVKALQAHLTELARTDKRYQPFVAQLGRLAQGFDLNSIGQLLEEYLTREM